MKILQIAFDWIRRIRIIPSRDKLSFSQNRPILSALNFLKARDKRKIYSVIFLTVSFGILDLLGVMLIGVIGSLSVTGLGSSSKGNRVIRILDILNLEDYSLQKQVSILGFFAALVLITKTLLSLVYSKRSLYFLARKGAELSSNLVSKYLASSLNLIQNKSAQESIYALTTGVGYVMVGVIGVWMLLVSDISLLVLLGFGLFLVDFKTAIGTVIIFSIVSIVLNKLMNGKVRELGNRQAKLSIKSSQLIFESIVLYRELLVRNSRGSYAKKISEIRYELADASAQITFMHNISKYALELTLVVSSLTLAAYQFTTTTASRAIAVVTVFIAASTRIVPAVLRIQQGLVQIKSNMGQAKPAIELMIELRDFDIKLNELSAFSREHLDFQANIEVNNLYYEYLDGIPVLESINLKATTGEFIAIVGNSGAGKSTLIDIILGVNLPKAGSVKISGMEPLIAFGKWPGAIGYVPQDCQIIDGTIRENLALGFDVNQIEENIFWQVLDTAHLTNFVTGLEKGLDTKVGDRGTKLSGGQRQRLGIARSLISNPKLLILDEATSALDAVTENEIAKAILNLKGNITLIVVAHRLSTILQADNIYYMKQGKVLNQGTFEELKVTTPEFLAQSSILGL